MLIGNIVMRDDHVRVYDVDGSYVEYSAIDAIRLALWIFKHNEEIGKYLNPQEDFNLTKEA